mgnify:CR=1 FL=1
MFVKIFYSIFTTMKKLLAIGAALALFGAGCASTSQTAIKTGAGPSGAEATRPNPTPPATVEVAPQAAPLGANGIFVADQKVGAEVHIGNVVISKQGYVVIHADANGKPGKILAASALLNAGETRDVFVKTKIEPGISYWAMLHADNRNKKFNGTNDTPITNERGEVVMKRFKGEGKAAVGIEVKSSVKVGGGIDVTAGIKVAATIQSFAFSPKIITVKKGSKIAFTNMDSVGHTVTADDGAFTSATLAEGTVFMLDTETLAAGSYGFHCAPHPFMTGTLVVE